MDIMEFYAPALDFLYYIVYLMGKALPTIMGVGLFLAGVGLVTKMSDSILELFIPAFLVFGSGVLLFLTWFYVPSDAVTQTYVSEEHSLAAVGNTREQVGESSGAGNLFFYASTTTIENVDVLQYVRTSTDREGREFNTVHSWPMEQVRVYENSDQEPIERHHHTRVTIKAPFTGETEVLSDRLDYVEITVPENAVANNYEISVGNN